jgi:glycosyltransferase involved in cell wall biosynthesis
VNIVFVCNEYPPAPHGGVGTFTQVAGRALVRAGNAVRVVGYGEDRPERWFDEGVEVFRLRPPAPDILSMRARLGVYSKVAEWRRTWHADLVEVPDAEGWGAGWPRLPIPMVVRIHGSASYFAAELNRPVTLQSRLAYRLEKSALQRADHWCSVSRYAAEKTREIFGLRPCDAVLHNPVESFPEPDWERRNPDAVLFTGTLTEKKGVLSLARAWPSVLRRRPSAVLHVAGKGGCSMRERMTALMGDAASSVQFHGHTPRETVLEMLQTARVAVFPSYAEAFALAPMEAMATGCPTVYSKRGSGAELMESGRDGILVDPDRPEEIAAAVAAVLADDGLAQRLGRGGWQRVRSGFGLEEWVSKTEDFYRRCIREFREKRECRAAEVQIG